MVHDKTTQGQLGDSRTPIVVFVRTDQPIGMSLFIYVQIRIFMIAQFQSFWLTRAATKLRKIKPFLMQRARAALACPKTPEIYKKYVL